MRRSVALIATCLPFFAQAAWGDPSATPASYGEYAQSPEHFGAQLVLTPDEAQFVRVWGSSRAPLSLPSVDLVHRGSAVTAVLVFQGCTPDPSGKCDVVADFSVLGPGGAYISGGSGRLWSGGPMPGRLLLGDASMGLSFDATDPIGQYRVIVTVKDRVSGQTLSLWSALKVVE